MERLETGTRVLTVRTDNPSTNWEIGARDNCMYGVLGRVIQVSAEGHGLCYLVVHERSKKFHAWYDHDELFEANDIEPLLREAVAARRQAKKETRGYEEGLYRAASPDYAKGRWAAASDMLIAMNIARSNDG